MPQSPNHTGTCLAFEYAWLCFLTRNHRPSPLRNPIFPSHEETASSTPATTTLSRPNDDVLPSARSSPHASVFSTTPHSAQRNGQLTPQSNQRNGQSVLQSPRSNEMLQIVKYPVSSAPPPSAPLKNMSPFAPEPLVEQVVGKFH